MPVVWFPLQKRGGDREIFSFDAVPAEVRYQIEPRDEATPEKVFERRWAQAVLEQVAGRLQVEYRSAGMGERFDVLKDYLMDDGGVSYEEAAGRLGLSVCAVTSAIQRLRGRFRELCREEIAHTVSRPAEVDDEIRYLLTALSG
ncbi:MAG: hypothetical protein L0Z50_17555 [Verrucomicrobiales bacterium]|nr:hypothetical protein [Verrucomicrobiales bacterium]